MLVHWTTLDISSTPCVSLLVEARRGLWPVLLSSMSIQAEEFIEKNLEAILPHLLEINANNQVWHSSPYTTYTLEL